MAKSQGEYEEEKRKFQEQVPGQLMVLAFGKTPSGKFVPIRVKDSGELEVS